MARQISAALAIAAAVSLFGLASAASADVAVNATTQRDNKADHDKWKRTAPPEKKPSSSSEDENSASDAKSGHAQLSAKHSGELNGKLHLGDW